MGCCTSTNEKGITKNVIVKTIKDEILGCELAKSDVKGKVLSLYEEKIINFDHRNVYMKRIDAVNVEDPDELQK